MPARILLIDDDRFARQLYGDYLQASGFEVETAGTGEEGVERLDAGRFDVVVTDMLLPGLDGLGVLGESRRIDPDIGVVVITALDMVDPAVRAIKSGAFDYLVKPVSPEALQLSVTRCLEYRGLLNENAGLRRHLSLSQAAARIAGANRRDRAARMTVEALVAHASASLAILVERTPGAPPRLVASAGGLIPDPWTLETAVTTSLARLADADSARAPAPAREGAPLDDGHAYRILSTDEVLVCALVYPAAGASLEDEDLRVAQFLLRHTTQALSAIERLESAESLAYLDDLTQLFNGRYLHRFLDRLIGGADRELVPFSVLFIDLDRFKEVNDTHGHIVGSQLLNEVGRVLRGSIRETDVAVRYGGDEYVVILPETEARDALRVAERMRERIARHVFLSREKKSLSITASVGVACCPEHASDKKTLIDLADQAMYRGKRGSRNVVYLAAPDDVPLAGDA